MATSIQFEVEPGMDALNDGTDDAGAGLTSAARRAARRWARSHGRRPLSLAVATTLFAGIFVLRELSGSEGDAFSLLYVIPVAIVGLQLGLRGGFAAATVSTAALAVWLATREVPFHLTPLVVRAGIIFGVGLIAGWFSDEMRASSAAVVSENERLGALQRDQAALQAEVDGMRRRLSEQLRNATRVIERQERERRGIARQLHEEAAQAMAAALVTVGLLERGAERELTRAQFDDVRSQVRSSIADLRRIAAALRPPVLEEMGLAMALGRIAEIEAEHNAREVTFSTEGIAHPLTPEAEAATYRLIQEVIAVLDVGGEVDVSVATRLDAIEVVIDSLPRSADEALHDARIAHALHNGTGLARAGGEGERERARRCTALDRLGGEAPSTDAALGGVSAALLETRARVELVGGSLRVGALDGAVTRVAAEMPL
ncbi:MAG: sensor histidine kinase [Solirubrobacteraceae bacterium]